MQYTRFWSGLTTLALLALGSSLHTVAHAQLNFALTLDSGAFSPGGSGTIVLDTNPTNGDYTISALSPHISFQFNGITFTDADIYSPGAAIARLSGDDTQRRFQFIETTNFSAFVFFDHADSMGNNVELAFNPDGYINGEIFPNNYSALASTPAAVPEPGSIALMTGLAVTGAGLVRKRRLHS